MDDINKGSNFENLTVIQNIHEKQMDDIHGQYRDRIINLQSDLKESNINLNSEIRRNTQMQSEINEMRTRLEHTDKKEGNIDKAHELKIKEITIEYDETIKFLEQKLEEERQRCTNELELEKVRSDDELDKQRTEYEKYLIDIRYLNEQTKLKLLGKIEKLQTQLDQHKSMDVSLQSIKGDLVDGSDAKNFLNTIAELIEKLTHTKLNSQEERHSLMMKTQEMSKKLSLVKEKVRKLTKKNKEQTDKLNILNTSAKSNSMRRSNTQKSPFKVSELRMSVNTLKNDVQKKDNSISEMNRMIKVRDKIIQSEKEENQRLAIEVTALRRKLNDIAKKYQKETESTQRKLKTSRNKSSLKAGTPTSSRQYSRNNGQGLINFSIFTNTFNTESNISRNNTKNIEPSESYLRLGDRFNGCEESINIITEYDPQTLVRSRDMIKQILCISCSRMLDIKEFIAHVPECRVYSEIPNSKSQLKITKSEIFDLNKLSNDMILPARSKIMPSPSPMQTQASGTSPLSKVKSASKKSAVNQVLRKMQDFRKKKSPRAIKIASGGYTIIITL